MLRRNWPPTREWHRLSSDRCVLSLCLENAFCGHSLFHFRFQGHLRWSSWPLIAPSPTSQYRCPQRSSSSSLRFPFISILRLPVKPNRSSDSGKCRRTVEVVGNLVSLSSQLTVQRYLSLWLVERNMPVFIIFCLFHACDGKSAGWSLRWKRSWQLPPSPAPRML